MKKSALGIIGMSIAMAAMAQESMNYIERGEIHSSKPFVPKEIKEPTPFKKQDGIVSLISDYKQITLGDSKKSKVKQARTISKINEFLNKGFLNQDDISVD